MKPLALLAFALLTSAGYGIVKPGPPESPVEKPIDDFITCEYDNAIAKSRPLVANDRQEVYFYSGCGGLTACYKVEFTCGKNIYWEAKARTPRVLCPNGSNPCAGLTATGVKTVSELKIKYERTTHTTLSDKFFSPSLDGNNGLEDRDEAATTACMNDAQASMGLVWPTPMSVTLPCANPNPPPDAKKPPPYNETTWPTDPYPQGSTGGEGRGSQPPMSTVAPQASSTVTQPTVAPTGFFNMY